jgi:hypothetical protein
MVLFLIGWPVWSLITGRGARLSVTTGAPLTGLAVTQVSGWYWSGHFSLDPLSYGLLALGAVSSLALATYRGVWRRVDWSMLMRTGALFVGLAGAVVALFTIGHQRVFRIGYLSTGILVQPDLPNYVLWTDHIRSATVLDAGHIAGFHLGHAVADTTSGTFFFLGSSAAWLDRSTWEASLPVALVAVFLIACASRDLAKAFLGSEAITSALIGLAAVAGSLFVYAVGFYPLSQLVGMAGMVGVTVVLARIGRVKTRERLARGVLEAVPPAIVVLLSYPHMALLSAPVIAGIAVAACWGPEWRPRATRTVIAAAALGTACVVIVPGRVAHAVDYVSFTGGAPLGPFPFPLITPIGFIGLQGEFSYRTTTSHVMFAVQALVLGAILGIALLRSTGRTRSRLVAATVTAAGVFASYGVVYLVRGASYAAFKWAAFFLPLFAVGVLATLAALILKRRPTMPRLRLIVAAGLAVVITGQTVAAFSASNEFDSVVAGSSRPSQWLVVDEPLERIGDGPAWSGIRAVDIDLPSLWESTWSSYFVAPRRVFMLAGGSATLPEPSPARPSTRWRLVHSRDPGANPPRAEVRQINDRYLLIRDDPDGYQVGDVWVVGRCAGIYRFDGRRWRAVQRTTSTGRFDLAVAPAPQPVGTRAPLLVRRTLASQGRDSLMLEYLADGRGRLLFDHKLHGTGPRHAGEAFALPRDVTTNIDVTMDPITSEVRARVGGRLVLDTQVRFFRARHGVTLVGVNPLGLLSDSLKEFPGTLVSTPQPRLTCAAPPGTSAG